MGLGPMVTVTCRNQPAPLTLPPPTPCVSSFNSLIQRKMPPARKAESGFLEISVGMKGDGFRRRITLVDLEDFDFFRRSLCDYLARGHDRLQSSSNYNDVSGVDEAL
ncbi:hypothetical protein NPIL_608541 [Nephila pilipes]|uniref:Uncharacterized protein n=1 Tax=Nephila pilipes TaxID=299642 RepID=A0A8X6MM93_NEPPI|nr:hypothetical protein NPIL_608541 [Nephila pilipes]